MAFTRLEAAFLVLNEREAILAVHDVGCCASCGHARLVGELSGRPQLAGYCFYSGEETDEALESRELYIRFGARSSAEQAAVALTAERVLRTCGLQMDWDGDPDCSILVTIPREDLHFLEGLRSEGSDGEEEEEGIDEGDSEAEEDGEEGDAGEREGSREGEMEGLGLRGVALPVGQDAGPFLWGGKRQCEGAAAAVELPYASEAFEMA